MKFFKTAFFVFARALIKKKFYVLMVFALPFLVLELNIFMEKPSADNFVVGICTIENTNIEAQVIDDILNNENDDICFEIEKNIGTLYRKVASGKYVCGYVFEKGFEESIQDIDPFKSITLLCLPENPYIVFTNEIVAASVYKQVAYIATENFLSKNVQPSPYTKTEITNKINEYLQSDQMLDVDVLLQGVKTDVLPAKEFLTTSLVRGIIAIYLLFLALVGSVYSADIVRNGNLKNLAVYKNRFVLQFCYQLPQLILAFGAGVCSIIICKLSASFWDTNIFVEIAMLALYQLTLAAIGFILSRIFAKEILLAIIPFVLIGAFILSPILFDISLFVPVLLPLLKLLPAYQYIVLQSGLEILPFAIFTFFIMIILLFIVCKIKRFDV